MMNNEQLTTYKETAFFTILNRKGLYKTLEKHIGLSHRSFDFDALDVENFTRIISGMNVVDVGLYPTLICHKDRCEILGVRKSFDVFYNIYDGRAPYSKIFDLFSATDLILKSNNLNEMRDLHEYIRSLIIRKAAEVSGYRRSLSNFIDNDTIDGFINSLRIGYNTTPEELMESNDTLRNINKEINEFNYDEFITGDETTYTRISNTPIFSAKPLVSEQFDEDDIKYTFLSKYMYLDNVPLKILRDIKCMSYTRHDMYVSLMLISTMYKELGNNVDKLNHFYNDNKNKINVLTDLLIMAYISPYIAKDLGVEDFVKKYNKIDDKNKTIININKALVKIYNKVK